MTRARPPPLLLARTNWRSKDRLFGVKQRDRIQHMYVLGQTGTGKITLLQNMIWKDALCGEGIAFLDPHGDACEEIAGSRGIKIDSIRPGKPVENAFIESLNGRVHDECLNTQWFDSLADTRRALQDWLRDYNLVRLHFRLGDLAPAVFAAQLNGHGHSTGPRTGRSST